MNALPNYDSWKTAAPDDDDTNEATVDRMADEISADREKVGELLFDNLPSDDDSRDMEVRELANITAYATEAWTIIERLDSGLPLTPWQRELLPKFFRTLKPWMERTPILIREAAENEVEYLRKSA